MWLSIETLDGHSVKLPDVLKLYSITLPVKLSGVHST